MNTRHGLATLITAFALGCPLSADAQGTTEFLWPDSAGGPSGTYPNFRPTLTTFAVSGGAANGAAVLICPGGGYWDVADPKEGTDVAKKFNTYGISAFVLRYRRAPGYKYPIPFDDERRAMRIIRSRAPQLGIDTSRIGILGFSAGGHLASTLAVHWDAGNPAAQDSLDRFSCRPAFAVLIYPVISMQDSLTHRDSKKNLLGDSPDPTMVTYLSSELQVNASTPPTFLVHTRNDGVVKFANALHFYNACVKANVKAKFLQYASGPHGFGLANGVNGAQNLPALAGWPDSCAAWLKDNGFFNATTSIASLRSPASNSAPRKLWNRSTFLFRSEDPGATRNALGKEMP